MAAVLPFILECYLWILLLVYNSDFILENFFYSILANTHTIYTRGVIFYLSFIFSTRAGQSTLVGGTRSQGIIPGMAFLDGLICCQYDARQPYRRPVF